MIISSKSKKQAVALSYITVILQALATMLLTRLYLNYLGKDAYGLYQMIYAVANYILILDLGISTVMIRYIAEFDVKGDKKRIENFAFCFGAIVLGIVALVVIIGIIVNFNIENIYTKLTPEEYALSHRMFRVMIVQLAFTVISHYFIGICEAYEHFTYTKFVSVIKILSNIGLNIIFLKSGFGIMGIVGANTIVIVGAALAYAVYSFVVLKFKIKFYNWDFDILKPAMVLMLAMLLQAIVGYVNSSVDKTILGIMTAKSDVTVYGIAATIITLFNTIPTMISSVFQPSATKLVMSGADGEKLTDFVVRPGRLQFMLMGGFLAGFVLCGKDFILCWTGDKMPLAWEYVLIIMIPNSIPLMQNTCLSILNAKDKRIFRSVILVAMTGFNILMTVLLIPVLGPIGAPIGTSLSYIIGHCIIMNIYYKRKIGLNVVRMFRDIFSHSWMCVLVSLILTFPLYFWNANGNWFILIAKGMIYCTVFAVTLYFYGLNKAEKKMIISFVKTVNKIAPGRTR